MGSADASLCSFGSPGIVSVSAVLRRNSRSEREQRQFLVPFSPGESRTACFSWPVVSDLLYSVQVAYRCGEYPVRNVPRQSPGRDLTLSGLSKQGHLCHGHTSESVF